MKDGNGIVLALVAIGVGLVLVTRRTGQLVSVLGPGGRNINDLVPSPAQTAAYWGQNATGNPTPGQGPEGQGTVQPGTLAGRLASWLNFGAGGRVWVAPNAGTTTVRTKSADPAGIQTIGPSTPSTYTPQSQNRPQSLFLGPGFQLAAPLAFNPMYMGLSSFDPYAAAASGSGGYVDTAIEPAGLMGLSTSEHA